MIREDLCEAFVLIPSGNPGPLFDLLLAEMIRHDMDVVQGEDGTATLHLEQDRLRMEQQRGAGLLLSIEAGNSVALHRIRLWIVEHLDELLPELAPSLRWSDDGARSEEVLPPYFHQLTLSGKRLLPCGLMRLTFHVDGMERLAEDGIHVKLLLPPAGRDPVWPKLALNGGLVQPVGADTLAIRTYTIRAIRPASDEIDVDVVVHTGGVFSDWAASAPAGEVIGLLGPSGFQKIPPVAPFLIAADATAAPAAARMIEALARDQASSAAPEPSGGHVILGLGTDRQAADYLEGLDLAALGLVVQGLGADVFSRDIEAAIRSAARDAPPGFAWFAGEHRDAQRLRPVFRNDFALGKGAQYAIAYWTEGRRQGA